MLKQGSSDPTSPRREASLFDLPGPSGPGFFLHLAGAARSAHRRISDGDSWLADEE